MKISVLTPSYNSASDLVRSIESVLQQDYKNYEHIIVDGGSNDGTLEILKSYTHLKWISEPDKGQSDAMNKAFNLSDGEIIMYLNADDYLEKDAFNHVISSFEQNPGVDIVVGNLFVIWENHPLQLVKPEIEYKKILLHFKYVFPWNPVSYYYKRKVQEEIGGFPLNIHYAMDYWFLINAFQKFNVIKIDHVLGYFSMVGETKTATSNSQFNTGICAIKHCLKNDKIGLINYFVNLLIWYRYARAIKYLLKKLIYNLFISKSVAFDDFIKIGLFKYVKRKINKGKTS